MESERTVYELFKWSVIIKGLISLAEVISGLVLLLVPAAYLISLTQAASLWLAAHASLPLSGHVAAELAKFGAGTAAFVAFYLLTRGLIKCFLIYALLRNILWAYPASLIVLGVFVLYQLYQIATAGSVFVIAITLFDLVVMYFIWREWKIVKARQSAHVTS